MSEKATPYSFGWIDFDKKDRETALQLIAENKVHGAVDELGLGTIRDAFANFFFPGTSTIQTRARYFLLVPYWINCVFDDYKKKSITADKYHELYIKKEKSFIEELNSRQPTESSKKEKGIIGATILNDYDKDRWLVRTIEEIYWAGIWEYGLIENKKNSGKRLSIREFEKRLLSKNVISRSNSDKKGNVFDDAELDASSADDAVFSSISVTIDSTLIDELDSIKDKPETYYSLRMAKDEAELLKQKIIDNASGSVLAIALSQDSTNFVKVKSVGDLVDMPAYKDFKYELQLAKEFSEFADFLGKRFNFLLGYKEDDKIGAFKQSPEINPNTIEEIFSKFRLNSDLKKFLKSCYDAKDDLKELDKLIIEREISLKHGRAKIGKMTIDDALVDYNYAYRLDIAQQIVLDILEGLQNG